MKAQYVLLKEVEGGGGGGGGGGRSRWNVVFCLNVAVTLTAVGLLAALRTVADDSSRLRQ